jgi:transposase
MQKQLTAKKFVEAYIQAYNDGLSPAQLADKIGLSRTTVHSRASKYKNLGILLPQLCPRPTVLDKNGIEELNTLIKSLLKNE